MSKPRHGASEYRAEPQPRSPCTVAIEPLCEDGHHRLFRAAVLFAIVLIGGWLRFHGIGNKSLWFDESISWRLSTFPVPEIIARTGSTGTVHPPCYFVLLRGWSWLAGDSEVALRSLSALCGVGTIVGTYWMLREGGRLGSNGADAERFVCHESWPHRGSPTAIDRHGFGASVAAALVALNAQHIHASRQVRMYSLGSLLVVLSSCMLFKALAARRPHWPAWAAYAILALAACYTHYFAALSVAAQLLFAFAYLLARAARRTGRIPTLAANSSAASGSGTSAVPSGEVGANDARRIRWAQLGRSVAVAIVLAVCYVPWIGSVARHSATFRTTFPNPTTPRTVVVNVYEALLGTPADVAPVAYLEGIVASAVLLAIITFLFFGRTALDSFLIVTGTLPALVGIGYSLLSDRSAFYSRYLSFAQLSWLAGLALLCQRVRPWPERWLVTMWVLGWGMYSCGSSWQIIGPTAEPGMRAAVQYILNAREESEPVLVQSPFAYFAVLYHARDCNSKPLLCSKTGWPETHECPAHLARNDLITPDALGALNSPGAWLVRSRAYKDDPNCDIALPDNWKLVHSSAFSRDYRRWEGSVIVEHYRAVTRDQPDVSSITQATIQVR